MAKKKKTEYDNEDMIFCSFCGRLRQEVNKLLAGPDGVFICDECIGICNHIMIEELGKNYYDVKEEESKEKVKLSNLEALKSTELPTPENIKQVLDEYVIRSRLCKKSTICCSI